MKKSRGVLSLVVTAVLIVLLGYTTIFGFGAGATGSAKNIKLGLDLAGGVSITYQVKEDNPSSEDMADTIYKLQRRVEEYSTEAQVYQEGDDRINIEIPGVSDANAILEELGQPGSLYFIAQTGSDGSENYSMVDTTGDPAKDYVLNKSVEELEADGSIVVTGDEVKDARAGIIEDQNTRRDDNVVSLVFTEEGTEKFAEATKKAYENGESIAIYYDGSFVSVPNVNSEINDGQAQITGSMSYDEAETLASTIRIGGLQLELEELRSNVVGAQLGEQAISTSLMAGAIGLAIIFVFMIFVYYLPGLASSLALIIYTELVLLILNAFDVTLTLQGIAGIILSIGMAVDANVIIFARVKEEMSRGNSVRNALKAGLPQSPVRYRGRQCDHPDRGGGTVVLRLRIGKGIRPDPGHRYHCVHVHGAGDHPYDRVRVLCGGDPQSQDLLPSQERAGAHQFPGQEEDLLLHFSGFDPAGLRGHGSQPWKRGRGLCLQPGLPGRNFHQCNV